jgi:hypothetical protein
MKRIFAAASALLLIAVVGNAAEHEAPLKNIAETKIRTWISDPAIVNAVKAQNEKHASLTQADIDTLDKQWRAETKAAAKPLIDPILNNDLSKFLKKVAADSKGLYTEVFVMDNKGLNVGQSEITSDYWQGDEAKWQKTFSVGPDAVFVDKIEKDESTQVLQSQVSLSVVDPATKKVIGAVTVGVNVDALN